MHHHDALIASLDLTQHILDAGPIVDGTAPTPCTDFDVGALVEHIIGTHHFLASAAGSNDDPVSGSPAERHRHAVAVSVGAWRGCDLGGSVDLGGHELPATFVLSLHVLEAYVHGWDLAMALDRPFVPSTDLTAAAHEAARTIITDDARGEAGAPYGPAVVPPGDASDVDALIAFAGRDVRWHA